MTHFGVAFYNVDLYRRSAREQVNRRTDIHWLESAEICQGISNGGTPLDLRQRFLLGRAAVINPWD